jgi:hypothetical protein
MLKSSPYSKLNKEKILTSPILYGFVASKLVSRVVEEAGPGGPGLVAQCRARQCLYSFLY